MICVNVLGDFEIGSSVIIYPYAHAVDFSTPLAVAVAEISIVFHRSRFRGCVAGKKPLGMNRTDGAPPTRSCFILAPTDVPFGAPRPV